MSGLGLETRRDQRKATGRGRSILTRLRSIIENLDCEEYDEIVSVVRSFCWFEDGT
jgi:hypothetical protein